MVKGPDFHGNTIQHGLPSHQDILDHLYRKAKKKQANLKILVLGEQSVGKTALLNRYFDNKFREIFITTIGIDYRIGYVQYGPNQIVSSITVWDTAGAQRFRNITNNHMRGLDSGLLV